MDLFDAKDVHVIARKLHVIQAQRVLLDEAGDGWLAVQPSKDLAQVLRQIEHYCRNAKGGIRIVTMDEAARHVATPAEPVGVLTGM